MTHTPRPEAPYKRMPIRTGDKFKMATGIWEVTGTAPGGKVYLFNRQSSRFIDTWTNQMRDLERVT